MNNMVKKNVENSLLCVIDINNKPGGKAKRSGGK